MREAPTRGDRSTRPPTEHVLYQRMFVDRTFAEQAFDDRTFTPDAAPDEQ